MERLDIKRLFVIDTINNLKVLLPDVIKDVYPSAWLSALEDGEVTKITIELVSTIE